MQKEIFDECEKALRHRNEQAHRALLNRRVKLYKEYPMLQELEDNLKTTGLRIAQVTFARKNNFKEGVESIIAQNQTDQLKIKQILTQAGYSEDYLSTPFTCKECNDSGYVLGIRCECFKKLLSEKRIEYFNSKSQFKDNYCFEQFYLDYYIDPADRNHMTNVFNNCVEYAMNFSSNSKNIIMMGGTGLGKTHLSFSIAKYIVERGFSSLHFSAPELFRILNDEFFGKGQAGVNTIDAIKEADLFILDDLGAEVDGKVVIPMLYNIIEARLNSGKPTIISTNLPLIAIEKKYNDKIASRLLAYLGLKFAGKDIRQIKLQEELKKNSN